MIAAWSHNVTIVNTSRPGLFAFTIFPLDIAHRNACFCLSEIKMSTARRTTDHECCRNLLSSCRLYLFREARLIDLKEPYTFWTCVCDTRTVSVRVVLVPLLHLCRVGGRQRLPPAEKRDLSLLPQWDYRYAPSHQRFCNFFEKSHYSPTILFKNSS